MFCVTFLWCLLHLQNQNVVHHWNIEVDRKMAGLDFERIYLNSSRAHGRFRLADKGVGWKAVATGGSSTTAPFLLGVDEMSSAMWSRGSRGWELRIQTKDKGVVRLDGFDQQDFQQLKNEFQRDFNIQLDHREHSLRGWNWGDLDLTRNEVVFQVQGKPAFEIPYSMINNSNLAGKHEVAVDMSTEQNSTQAGDELVEMRFYIPGVVENDEQDSATPEGEAAKEEISKANAFYEQLKEKADIGIYSGDAIASFTDVLFLTPRGRFDMDFYENSLRLRGKTYDHKIHYSHIERIFSLPKPDDIHHLMVIQVNPPLRQGQTPYPFLVLQIVNDEELELEINLPDDEFKEKYENRLKKKYDQQTHLVLSHVLRGLTERRIQIPGSFSSNLGQAGLPCSLKVNEGYLYLLEKCFLFVPKPTVYIPYLDVEQVVISRVGDLHVHRTFDLEVRLRSGSSHKFSNISKDEASGVSSFLKQKNVRVKNEEEEQNNRIKAALAEESDSDANMGSADEDESPDEDFNAGSSDDDDDDLAEEYDSDAPMSDEDSDGPPAKKAKV